MEPSAPPYTTDWAKEEGIPSFEDSFIQKYIQGREALIEEEKKQRQDASFRKSMTPTAVDACRIVECIRARELKDVWTGESKLEEKNAEVGGQGPFPGTMFRLARDRMESTDLWKIMRRMPKGALLHGHLEAMIDLDLLVDQVLSLPGIYMASSTPLVSEEQFQTSLLHFKYSSAPPVSPDGTATLWTSEYQPLTFLPAHQAAAAFPDRGAQGFREWLKSRCTITQDESLNHHHPTDAVWTLFKRAFQVVDSILYYEPIFRACMRQMLAELDADGIRYIEFRLGFDFHYRRNRCDSTEEDYMDFFDAFDEEIENYKATNAGKRFYGARMIWSTMRGYSDQEIVESMKQCILTKMEFPDLISGFDLAGCEDEGRPLAELVPLLFWFKKQCATEGVEIPFFFHAGECLGDGNETDRNLFDAILLGTRRIGHAFSLFKHPLLINLVKEKKILIECCPISNEILGLASSISAHPLPALLSRGVAVALCNDDPALLGHGNNGLTHDFCQVLNGFENTGLSGIAAMAENSLRWSCFEDQNQAEWLEDIKSGMTGKGSKAAHLKEWHIEFEKFCQWVVMEFGSEIQEEAEENEPSDTEAA